MGIQAKNCKEWYLMHLAGFYSGATTVALYDTLGKDAMKYIINQVGMVTVTLTPDLAEGMINMVAEDAASEGKVACLKNIITLGDIKPEVLTAADNAGIKCYTYDYVLNAGKDEKLDSDTVKVAKMDDIFMLCYTSGTTGDPKGVKFNHKMFVNNTEAATKQFPNAADKFTEKDCYISYLPAAHSFE